MRRFIILAFMANLFCGVFSNKVSCNGDPNASPGCGINCNRRCSDIGKEPQLCITVCKENACDCKDGFYLDEDTGKCVRYEDCRSCNDDPNAIPGCGIYCNRRCSDIGKEPQACITLCKVNACDCKKGFYLNEYTRKCVPAEDCPSCGANEVYSNCIEGYCAPKTCRELGKQIPCPDINPEFCKEGCLCKSGYVRNDNGCCIPVKECPCCGGDPNAESGCGVNCNRRCSTYGKEPQVCPEICEINGCDCKDGFLLDEATGRCVLPCDCNPNSEEEPACFPVCGANEVYDDCINAICRAQNCYQIGQPIACPSVTKCYGGCACKLGYLRVQNGTCVPERKCPPQSCSKNEVYNDCIQGQCGPKNCKQLGKPLPCPRIDPKCCKKGCLCKDGYVREENGVCIPKGQCPSCGGDRNAQSGCGGHCNRRCSNYNKPPKPCPKICEINGCDCREGFIYDDDTKKCVRPCDCTQPVCDINEIPSDCVNGGCDKRNCSQLRQPDICIDPLECIKGCVCKENYLRADNGTCVPIDECYTSACCMNEVYSNCTNQYCAPTECSQLGKPLSCLTSDMGPCKAGCMCQEGYVRAANKVCIPIEECPSCGDDPNARSGCGVNCGRLCSNYNKGPVACPAICKLNGCDCKKDYVYDSNTKKCVLPKNCTPTCGKDEVYSNCTNQYCTPSECCQLGIPLFCPATGIRPCIAGCVCREGYVRADNRTCIPKEQCSSCGGDPNARSGCGVNCGRLCSNYNKGPVACPEVCNSNGCDCKENYVYDECTKKCVLPEHCQPPVDTTTGNNNSTRNATASLVQLQRANLAMTGAFLNLIYKENPSSYVFSAISCLTALGVLGLVAVDETGKQIINGALDMQDKEQVQEAFLGWAKLFDKPGNVTLTTAVAIYGNNKYPFSDQFQGESKAVFNANIENIDFAEQQEAAQEINEWVANKTHNLIPSIIVPDMLDVNTVLVLLNAIYLLGTWAKQFNEDRTQKDDFYITPNKTQSIDFMQQESSFEYRDNDELQAQTLRMYYEGNNMSLIIFLPNNRDGLPDMIKKLNSPDVMERSFQSFNEQRVNVKIPKFKIETALNLKDLLNKYGITRMFGREAEFKGMLKDDIPVHVTDALQKATIIVDEKGTQAAVVTGVVVETYALVIEPPDVRHFIADHPFIFTIMLQDEIIFCGGFLG